jgi:hypothetical protein
MAENYGQSWGEILYNYQHYLAQTDPATSIAFDGHGCIGIREGKLHIIIGEKFYAEEQATKLFDAWNKFNS